MKSAPPAQRPWILSAMLALAMLASGVAGAATKTKIKRLDSAPAIADEAAWQRLAARPEASATARTEVVKFLLDLEGEAKLWFIDTEKYPFHFAFARDRLAATPDHAMFNRREYSSPRRRFEMGSVVHYLDADLWTLELVSGDTLAGDRILRLFERVRDAVWIGDQLRFHPLSDLHVENIAGVRDRLPVVLSDVVYGGVRYQALTNGDAFGYLRIVAGALDLATVRADQILVLGELPEEIPVSAGVISQQLQAPLGHIAILCATRGTPNMALRGALEHEDVRRLDGRLVQLRVGPQEFELREAALEEAEKHWKSRRPKRPQVPRLDPKVDRLLDVAELRLRDTDVAGAKAAQLGEVTRLKNVRTPGGFVIPVAHYVRHREACGAAADLAGQLADPRFGADAEVRAQWLAAVRASIEDAPIEADLVRAVRARMQTIAPDARWILRSSTNAEDLAGFTGAGLYRSVRVKAGASEADLAKAIREVWASVWLQGAFEERAWYRVDHAAVGMAILVQPFVDGAKVNGVAITANPFAEMQPGYFINAQALGGSVTGARGEEIPEQHLVYTFMEELESEVLSRSSRNGGQPLLGSEDIRELAGVLKRLHEHLVPKWRRANAVDVEFLIVSGEPRVVILQARPYQVVYTDGQRVENAEGSGRGYMSSFGR